MQVLNLLRSCPDVSLNHLDGNCKVSIWQDCACPDVRIGPSGCFTLKNRRLKKNLQNFNFSQVSFRTRMYNPPITQSGSVSKLSRDIKES
jgi:hypothetical protein